MPLKSPNLRPPRPPKTGYCAVAFDNAIMRIRTKQSAFDRAREVMRYGTDFIPAGEPVCVYKCTLVKILKPKVSNE